MERREISLSHDVYTKHVAIVAEISSDSLERCFGEKLSAMICRNELMKALKEVYLFSYLPEIKVQWLSEKLKLEKYKKSDIIIQENTIGKCFYIIKSGSVEIFKGNSKIRTIGKLEFFGERALFFEEMRSATCIAENECELWALDKANFFEIIDSNMK